MGLVCFLKIMGLYEKGDLYYSPFDMKTKREIFVLHSSLAPY